MAFDYESLMNFGRPNSSQANFNMPTTFSPQYMPDMGSMYNQIGSYGMRDMGQGMGGSTAGDSSLAPGAMTDKIAELNLGGGGLMDGFKKSWGEMDWFGGKGKDGMKTMGKADYLMGGASAALNAFMGMKQYGLQKDQFNFQKNAFNKQFTAQAGLTNASLSDRQQGREAEYAFNGNKGVKPASTADYMSKYGVKA